uniref:Uncharacterized protein n=1 Tax=Pyrodinium bahamense TaxID=73915 RepID=A0A7R9ZWM4_9DINO
MAPPELLGSSGDVRPEPWDDQVLFLEEALGPQGREQGAAAASGPLVAGADGSQALVAAREHLASVSEELACIQRQFDEECAGVAPPGLGAGTAARAGDSLDARALEVQLRHLEVDRDEANMRAARLAREKEELLAVQAQLEAELRATRQTLDETRRRLRHRELDLQQYAGHSLMDRRPLHVEESATFAAAISPKAQTELPVAGGTSTSQGAAGALQQRSSAGPSRFASSVPKPQMLASLQAELREEQGRHEKLERKMRKERERMEGLVVLAERQRGEIGLLRRRGDLFEAYAGECERRLRQSFAQVEVGGRGGLSASGESLAIGVDNGAGMDASGAETSPPATPFGERGGGGRTPAGLHGSTASSMQLSRQQSAPMRLPNVSRGRG